jgi:cytochrome c553
VYFEQDVLPVLQSSCSYSGCHDAATAEEGIVLESFASMMNSSESNLVVAGQPQNSELYDVLVEDNPDKLMPPPEDGGPLSQEQIDLIWTWLEQGALNNSCADCDSTLASYSGAVALTLAASCTSCHSGATPESDVDLSTHANVVDAVTNRNLMGCIRHEAYAPAMPPSGNPLTDCQIQQFQNWIDAGMPND